jgi:mono/diheme cytochrome c family protein
MLQLDKPTRRTRSQSLSTLAGLMVFLFVSSETIANVRTAPVAAVQVSASIKSVYDGVYTPAQARRGKSEYDKNCGSCHSPDLAGNSVYGYPPLVGDAFISRWKDRTVGDLWITIRMTMPQNQPNALDAQTYVDVVAYLLAANDFPAGKEDLSADEGALRNITMRGSR